MKKLFIKFSMMLFVLGMSTNTMWGQETGQPIYLAAFKAQSAGESTGTGTVKLTWIDAQGELFANTAVAWLNYNVPPFNMPYGTGNPTNGDEFAETAMVIGATMTATESVEDSDPNSFVNQILRQMMDNAGADSSHLFMTPFAYFKADAQGDDGSYFAGWTFNDARVWKQDTAMDKSAQGSAYFKVLPSPANVMYMTPPSTVTGLDDAYAGAVGNPNYLYAVFNKYLLGNPVATSANIEATPNAEAHLTVTVEINGEAASLDAEDFASFSFSNNTNSEWTYDLAAALASKVVVSEQKTSITIPVTYTYKNTGYGLKNTTMTISMAGGENASKLKVNLSVDALNPDRAAAFLLNGKDDASPVSGTLTEILATDISGYSDPIVKLNKQVSTDLTFSGKDFTLDLNGNTTQAITVSGGNVTIAYSKYGGSATSLTVNGGKAILNGGTFGSLTIGTSGTVEQNGATISGAAENNGSLTATDGTILGGLTSSKTLVINGGTFKGATAITVSGGTAAINRGTIDGVTCGLKVIGGEATTKKLAAIKGETYSAQRTGGTLTVESGKFDGALNGTIDFTAGFFKNVGDTVGLSAGKTGMLVSIGVEYNEGYRYFLGTAETAVSNGVGVCRIGNVSYAKLEDAIAFANNNPSVADIVIFMTNNYTLPAGYYTLPANATIVVPMSDEQAKEINYFPPRLVFNDLNTRYSYEQPTEFRRLTFASGVNMDVFGAIEMTCTQLASNEAYTSQPTGAYGHLVMEEGSHMTLMANSEIRAWGYMTGKGETDARRDAKVCEMFQMGDWKGALTSVRITGMVPPDFPLYGSIGDDSDKKIFPVSQYFIQNIESPVKYHPGAVLSTSAAVSEGINMAGGISVSMMAPDIKVVGVANRTPGVNDDAIFLLDNGADADNTWVRKWYDSEKDIQVYDINSAAHIGSMEIDLGDLSLMGYAIPVRLNSAKFDLPLTSNFKIHLLSGNMDFKQNTSLLPGAEVEVDKEATVSVAMDKDEKDAYEAWIEGGKAGDAPVTYTGALYVYDADQWGKYAYCNEYDGMNLVKGKAYTKVVRYAPSWNGRPTKRAEQTCPPDATINVHGTFMTDKGFVYTSESGANIFSSNEDAGTFIFNESASDAGTRTVYNVEGAGTYRDITFSAAQLKNGNGEHLNTSDAEAGDAYCYQNDEWSTMIVDPEDPCFMVEKNVETGDKYYIKPADYVEVVVSGDDAYGHIGNADHTFSDAAGTGRLFILMLTESGDCDQWWEVEKKDNLYHCIHPQNDTYYYWDEGDYMWKEKTYTITWKNWNGDIIQTKGSDETYVDEYVVPYGTVAEFFGANPTREKDADSIYNFTGWKPALGPVTQDVIYTATFKGEQRKYTIIFQNEGGVEIERQFLTHNEVPVCENTPTKVGHILQWSPAIGKVVADATYVANWLEVPPTKYEIRFLDYDGSEITSDSVTVGETPEPPAFPSNKPETAENTYTCSSWDAEVVPVTEAATYTAVYTPVAKTFTVTFLNEDGSEIEHHDYKYGETPVCSNIPPKENTAEYTYGFAWVPNIQTVQGPATYQASFPATTNKYTVTLKSNLSGVCTFSGAGTYDYGTVIGTDVPNVEVFFNNEKYTFNGWNDGENAATHPAFTLTQDTTFTADFTPKAIVDQTVAAGTTWDVPANTEVKDLIITSNGVAAGQLTGDVNHLQIRGEAIYRLQQSFDGGKWYAVAVPWRVDPNSGIFGGNGRLVSGSQIFIIEFDGAAYANYGGTDDTNQYWHFLDQTGNDMLPGKLYMVYLTSAQSKLDFHKKAGAPLQTKNLTVSMTNGSAGSSFANWNAISNPALYTADLSTGVTAYQTYDNNDSQSYTVVDESTSALIVAKPIFVQVNTQGTVYATVPSGASPAPAYRRAPKAENDVKYVVEIAQNNQMTDRLIVETAEEKDDKYVIGQDLAKMGVSSKVAQMWINRYDAKLCKNTVAFWGEQVEYPLTISAPKAGEYKMSIQNSVVSDQYALYLTLNGEAIWNLSESDFVLTLEQGTTAEYGLRVSAKAPQVATGVDEAIVDAKGETKKVLINDKVFIIRGEKVYSIDGQLVK